MWVFLIIVKAIVSVFAVCWNLLVGFINIITSSLNKYIRKKNDEINRGVTEIRQSTIDSILPCRNDVNNTLISGSNANARARFIAQIAKNAQSCGYATVILYEGNNSIVGELQRILGQNNWININSQNPMYEPFNSLNSKEVCKTLYDSATKDYDLKMNCNYYIEGMCEFLKHKKISPTLKSFVSCPHADLFDKIDALVLSGTINDTQAQAIRSRLMMGQSEQFKLESLISDLYDQSESILCKAKGTQKYSVYQAIFDRKIIAIDISSNVNALLINSIISQIKQAISKGKNLVLITDDLTMSGNDNVKKILSEKTDKCKVIACSSDAFSMCDGDDKSFNTMIGNSEQIIILGHASGASCTKWAEAIGQYNKEEESQSYEKGSSRNSPFQLFPGSNKGTTVNYSIKREYIVRPELINRMSNNEVYTYDHVSNKLIHTFLV